MDFLGTWMLDNIKYECFLMNDDENCELFEIYVDGKIYSNYIERDEAETIFHAMKYGRKAKLIY